MKESVCSKHETGSAGPTSRERERENNPLKNRSPGVHLRQHNSHPTEPSRRCWGPMMVLVPSVGLRVGRSFCRLPSGTTGLFPGFSRSGALSRSLSISAVLWPLRSFYAPIEGFMLRAAAVSSRIFSEPGRVCCGPDGLSRSRVRRTSRLSNRPEGVSGSISSCPSTGVFRCVLTLQVA